MLSENFGSCFKKTFIFDKLFFSGEKFVKMSFVPKNSADIYSSVLKIRPQTQNYSSPNDTANETHPGKSQRYC